MLRLGSMLLTAVLMGVPRALEGRSFGTPALVHLKVDPHDPEIAAFADELARMLADASYRMTPIASRATFVVEVHGFAREKGSSAPERGALLVTLGHGRSRRPLVLEHVPGRGQLAARALLDALPQPPRAFH